ncbi:hypothetical protein K9L16_02280 [Candidatus Pacearchaeota archaeon]|nr:hypothetical protein [Candidatus Pacearchaeota archaeon]
MKECAKCGISETQTLLFDAISREGIKKMCNKCIKEENLPIMRRPNNFQVQEKEPEKQTVYQRLSKIAKLRSDYSPTVETSKPNNELLKIAEKNFKENLEIEENYDGLVEHYHWKMMRARRLKKITQKELAEKIKEPEEAIKIIELGKLPKGYFRIISKIEREIGVSLMTPDFREKMQNQGKKLDFDKRDYENMTIEDLRKMNKTRNLPRLDKKEPSKSEENENYFENKKTNNELSQDEIDKILFGR